MPGHAASRMALAGGDADIRGAQPGRSLGSGSRSARSAACARPGECVRFGTSGSSCQPMPESSICWRRAPGRMGSSLARRGADIDCVEAHGCALFGPLPHAHLPADDLLEIRDRQTAQVHVSSVDYTIAQAFAPGALVVGQHHVGVLALHGLDFHGDHGKGARMGRS